MSLQTMYPAKNNSPRTFLTADIAADDTTITLNNASVLPAAPNLLVFGTGDDAEIASYTAIAGNVVSGLVRGVNGTIPKAWETDTVVARNFTAADAEAFRENILDLDSRKVDTTAMTTALAQKQDVLTFDTAPTTNSTNPVTSDGIKTALNAKANLASPALTGTPTAPTPAASSNSERIATTAFVRTEIDKEILYFTTQTVSSQKTGGQIMRIPSTGTNSNITANTVVIDCSFTDQSKVMSDVTWTSYAGYITFNGTTSASTKADVILGIKGN